MKVVTPASYTLRFRGSLPKMWIAYWRASAGPAQLWRHHVIVGAVLTFALTITQIVSFSWVSALLTFAGATGATALILSFVALLQIRSTLAVVKVGSEGIDAKMGRVTVNHRWQDVRCIEECRGSIVIDYKAGGGVNVPDRAFADAVTRLRFLDDVRRWHALAGAANTEYV